MARDILKEMVEDIKRRVLDSKCLARDASIEKFKVEMLVEETKKRIESSKIRMSVTKLRLLQIEARIETLLAKSQQTGIPIRPEPTIITAELIHAT
ncbi:hypothetical protein GCM10027592_54230 [Spirosoma flavus]